ncbi:MAG: hypothetical protein PHS44_02680 [Candidatus Dojkabacteria bacterium]|jgi:hypothetical protein|nr:hypothetical protein [Candidatus Dojkabacteria bacterium]
MNKTTRLILILLIVGGAFIILRNDDEKAAEPELQGTRTADMNTSLECSSPNLGVEVRTLSSNWSCRNDNNELLLGSDNFDIRISENEYTPYCQNFATYDDSGNLIDDSSCRIEAFYLEDDFILSLYSLNGEAKEIGGSFSSPYGDKLGIHITFQTPFGIDQEQELRSVLNLID